MTSFYLQLHARQFSDAAATLHTATDVHSQPTAQRERVGAHHTQTRAAVDIGSVHAQNAKHLVVAACRAVPNKAKGIYIGHYMTGQPAKSESSTSFASKGRARLFLRDAKSVDAFMHQPCHVGHDGSTSRHTAPHTCSRCLQSHGMQCKHVFSRPMHVVAHGEPGGLKWTPRRSRVDPGPSGNPSPSRQGVCCNYNPCLCTPSCRAGDHGPRTLSSHLRRSSL